MTNEDRFCMRMTLNSFDSFGFCMMQLIFVLTHNLLRRVRTAGSSGATVNCFKKAPCICSKDNSFDCSFEDDSIEGSVHDFHLGLHP